MTKISPEEKRREAADWMKGLIGLAIVLGVIVIGYVVFQGLKGNLMQQEAKKPRQEKVTQNLSIDQNKLAFVEPCFTATTDK